MRTRIAVFACAAALLTGCSEVEKAMNRGGDTPCSEFTTMEFHDKQVTTRKFLENESRVDTTPSDLMVNQAVDQINLLCQLQANRDTPIRNADLVGILGPK